MPSREYTPEEVREKFLKTVWGQIEYWENEKRSPSSREKLEGLAHSIFALIDGKVAFTPAFILAPLPHKDDKDYLRQQGENFYPYNNRDAATGNAVGVKCDIGGNLAYQFYRVKEKMDKEK